MNFNSNNGTIVYMLNLSNIIPASTPDIIKISDYVTMIKKYGVDNIDGAKEFKKFIEKYPDIYTDGIRNENKDLDREKMNEIGTQEMEEAI